MDGICAGNAAWPVVLIPMLWPSVHNVERPPEWQLPYRYLNHAAMNGLYGA